MDKRCDTCANYKPVGEHFPRSNDPGAVGRPAGECRAGPPRPAADPEPGARWALVFADEWCGIHIPKPEIPDVLPFPADRIGPGPRALDLHDDDESADVLPLSALAAARLARGVPPGGGAR